MVTVTVVWCKVTYNKLAMHDRLNIACLLFERARKEAKMPFDVVIKPF